MEGTKGMMIILGKMMSKEQIIQSLEEAIDEYKEAKLLGKDEKEKYDKVTFHCHMCIINSIDKNPFELMKEMDQSAARDKMFKVEKN